MARKGNAESATGTEAEGESAVNGANGEAAEPTMPAGFRRRNAVTDAPWVHGEKGNVCQGNLLGRYQMQGNVQGSRYYYQVELVKDCKVRMGRGDDAEIVMAKKGDVVNLGESYKIACLKEVEIPELLAQAEYQVWVHFKDKIKISGGRSLWNTEVTSRRTKAPIGEVRALPADDASEGEADSAF
jgi:hypothetical protein